MHWSRLIVKPAEEAAVAPAVDVASTVVLVAAQEEPELLHSTDFSAQPTSVVAGSKTVTEVDSTPREEAVGSGLEYWLIEPRM